MFVQVKIGEGRLPAHGTRARYQHRHKPCSCMRCKDANARYQQEYRERLNAAARTPVQLTLDELLQQEDTAA